MESLRLVFLVLAAVALGAFLPLAFQLAATMHAARRMLVTVEPRLNAAIVELTAAAAAANRSLSALDEAALQRTAASVSDIGDLAKKARDFTATIEMASAVGAAAAPAIATLIRAWREPSAAPEPDEIPDQEAHNERPVFNHHRKEMSTR